MKNSNTKGETLFQRKGRYILTYTLKNGTKSHHYTLKGVNSMEEAESEATKYLSQYAELVTERKVILKASPGYILRYEDVDGKTKEKTLYDSNKQPVTDIKLAKQVADRFLNDIRKIKDIDTEEELLFKLDQLRRLRNVTKFKIDEVWDNFKNSPSRREVTKRTLKCYESYWTLFLAFIKEQVGDKQELSAINADNVKKFFAKLWADGKNERTYNAYLQGISYVMKIALGEDFDKMNPFKGICRKTLNTQAKKVFTSDEIKRMLALLEDGNKTFYIFDRQSMRITVKFMIYTGARLGDASMFRWNNIRKVANGYVLVYSPNKTKRSSGKTVTIPIHSDLLKELLPLMEKPHNETDFVIPLAAKRYMEHSTSFSRDGTRLIEAIGLKTKADTVEGVRRCGVRVTLYSLHSFRHTFVSMVANAGIPISVVRDMVGHTTDAMTMHYTHSSDQRKLDAIQSISLE